ncbi:MAG: hypothetical protein WC455_29170 [Dehalococcoidia bacterium]|jgi:hypothetical protein
MEKLAELKSLQASLANELAVIQEEAHKLSLRTASALNYAEDILRQICLMDALADTDVLMAKFNERNESPNA